MMHRKLDNLVYSFAMWTMWYNFGRKHQTLKMTPAMAAEVSEAAWTPEDVIRLIDARTPKPGPRGPYGPRNSN